MPLKTKAFKNINRNAASSLGLFKKAEKLKKRAALSNRDFDIERCEQQILEMAKAIPHQYNFLTSWDTKYIGLCGGFGCGKSWSLAAKAVLFAFRTPGQDIIFFAPSLPLINDITVPAFHKLFEQVEMPYTYRKTPRPDFFLHLPQGDTRVLLRSMEVYQRIVGINACAVLADEIDTCPQHLAEKAMVNIQARVRVSNIHQTIAVGSTPEGHAWMYNFFEVEADDSKKLVRGRTRNNPYLAPGFIEDLEAKYPPSLIKAYLEGQFVNLATATVFAEYDRVANNTNVSEPKPDEVICIGCDFNVKTVMAVIGVVRRGENGQVLHIFREHRASDTYDLAGWIAKTYERWVGAKKVAVYPDCTGNREYTSSTETDHQILRERGLNVFVRKKNPPVAETINHVNNCLHKKMLMVNSVRCFELSACLEQWSYGEDLRPIKGKGDKKDLSNIGDALRYLTFGAMPRENSRVRNIKRWR